MRLHAAILALLLLGSTAFAIVAPPPPDGPFSAVVRYDGVDKARPINPIQFSSFTEIVETRVGGSSVVHKSPGATSYSNLTVSVPTTGWYNDTNLKAWYNMPVVPNKDIYFKILTGSNTLHAAYAFYISKPVYRKTFSRGDATYAAYTIRCNSFERDLGVVP